MSVTLHGRVGDSLTSSSWSHWYNDYHLSCLFLSESDAEEFCILKLSVSVLNKIPSNEFFIYVAWVLECYSSCLVISLSDLAKSVGQLLPPGDKFIQPTMLCVNKGAQSNTFGFTQML